jgi:glycosyltransferase involved in cell wall biosynthesis
MCKEKGLDTLVAAYIQIRNKKLVPNLKLKIGGAMGPSDEPFVAKLKEDLRANGLLNEVEIHPNLDKSAKQAFMKSLSILSVPALYGEAFGLYLVEAWAAGVPVVQPRHAAFPELVRASGGGVICEANDPTALGDAIADVLNTPGKLRQLSKAAQKASREIFNVRAMAEGILRVLPKEKVD